jgi:hypothetical protein
LIHSNYWYNLHFFDFIQMFLFFRICSPPPRNSTKLAAFDDVPL